jgi:hypothetical protein
MIFIKMEIKHLVASHSSTINVNKVACIRISQEQAVFKTKKNKDPAQILSTW